MNMTNKEAIAGLIICKQIIDQTPTPQTELKQAIDTAITALEQSQWVSVDERLPMYGERVLIGDKSWVCEGYLRTDGVFCNAKGQSMTQWMDIDITHWMPLPEPPK